MQAPLFPEQHRRMTWLVSLHQGACLCFGAAGEDAYGSKQRCKLAMRHLLEQLFSDFNAKAVV